MVQPPNAKVSQKFCNILACAILQLVYCMTKAVQAVKVPTIVGSILIVGVLTCCALLPFLCDFKAVQMNVQCSLIQEFML